MSSKAQNTTLVDHFNNYEKLSSSLNTIYSGGLPGKDYNPVEILQRCYRLVRFDTSILENAMTAVIKNYIKYGDRIFELLQRDPKSRHHFRLLIAPRHFKITKGSKSPQQAQRRNRGFSKYQLMMCFPQFLAKVVTLEAKSQPQFFQSVLSANRLDRISPASTLVATFTLLPRYKNDADGQFLNVVKAMLLYQYREQGIVQLNNRPYQTSSNRDRMSWIISMAKIVYESEHTCGDTRWFCYRAFIIKEFYTLKAYEYSAAAIKFDQMFGGLVSVVEEAFALLSGSQKTLVMTDADVDGLMQENDPMKITDEELETVKTGWQRMFC